MNILLLLVFVSLVLALAGVGLFVWTVGQETYRHSSRLALLPLEGEDSKHATSADGDGDSDV